MDAREYNLCVKQWSDGLFRFACKCTGNTDDAHDVVQNSFEVLWQKRKEVATAKSKAFLFQVAYRSAVNNYRARKRITANEPPETSYAPAQQDLKRLLDKALGELDEQARALVLLKDYEGYRYEEIAHITNLTETQVKVYLHRARKTLKEYLVSIDHLI